ncbi:MAG: hypothetical protein KGY50_04475 [Candidatus Thermoplasmatota archaeon]|nr:hypothetical protein [Candidatus Thermoplasmatota archaeon]
MMNSLFEDEYMEIEINNIPKILEIKTKKVCDDTNELEKHIIIINQYVKDTDAKKLIFSLNNLDRISKESLLNDKFFPCIGTNGVKTIAIVTGENKKVQALISELGAYVSPLKETYNITSETFETYQQAMNWIIKK